MRSDCRPFGTISLPRQYLLARCFQRGLILETDPDQPGRFCIHIIGSDRPAALRAVLTVQCVKCFLEAAGVAFFSFRKRFKPIGDFVETFFAGGFRHPWIHVGLFMGFTGDSGFQVIGGGADRQTCCRIACCF